MLGTALAAVVAGVLIAALSGGGGHGSAKGRSATGHTEIQLAAGYLGLSAREVRRRLRHGESLSQIAESSAGHSQAQLVSALVAARAAELKRRHLPPAVEQAELARLRHSLRADVRRSRRGRGILAPAAAYLGIGEAQLQTQLASGRTLAQVVASRATVLALAVKDGQLTPAGERTALASLRARTVREVHRKLPGG